MEMQSIIFDKKHYIPNEAKLWLQGHNYESELDDKPLHYRSRQRSPSLFDKTSFRTKKIRPGIQLILGKPI